MHMIDFIAQYFGVVTDNYVIKLTMFQTIFNIVAVLIMLPFMPLLVKVLQTFFIPKVKSWAKPKYLDNEVIQIPKTAIISLRKENKNLYYNLLKAIKHLMNIKDEDIYLNRFNHESNSVQNTKIDKIYKDNLKLLHDEIIQFATMAQKNMSDEDVALVNLLKSATTQMNKLLKYIKTLQKNIESYQKSKDKHVSNEYTMIKDLLVMVFRELKYLRQNHNLDDIDRMLKSKTLKQTLNSFDSVRNNKIATLINLKKIDATMATHLINDLSFTLFICRKLIDVTTILWVEDKILLELGEEDEN